VWDLSRRNSSFAGLPLCLRHRLCHLEGALSRTEGNRSVIDVVVNRPYVMDKSRIIRPLGFVKTDGRRPLIVTRASPELPATLTYRLPPSCLSFRSQFALMVVVDLRRLNPRDPKTFGSEGIDNSCGAVVGAYGGGQLDRDASSSTSRICFSRRRLHVSEGCSLSRTGIRDPLMRRFPSLSSLLARFLARDGTVPHLRQSREMSRTVIARSWLMDVSLYRCYGGVYQGCSGVFVHRITAFFSLYQTGLVIRFPMASRRFKLRISGFFGQFAFLVTRLLAGPRLTEHRSEVSKAVARRIYLNIVLTRLPELQAFRC